MHSLLDRPARVSDADDADLMRAAADEGADGPAFRELYRRYSRPLYGFGRRRLADAGLAEELVQETFVRLWKRANWYDAERGTVGAMLFTIAGNVAVDMHRHRSRRIGTTDLATAPIAAVPAVSDAAATVDTGMAVRAAMDRLSSDHREVVELAYRGDLTQRQIADVLAIPLGTVKTRMFWALKSLKLMLLESGVAS